MLDKFMEWKLLEEKKSLAYFRSRNVEYKDYKQKKEKFKDKKLIRPKILWPKITQKRLNKCERNFTIR